MKLRLQSNAVRLRLNQAEVARFSSEGFLEEIVEFPGSGRFRFAIRAVPGETAVHARLKDGDLRIEIPREMAREWTATNRTGIEVFPEAGPSILIEKDFQCLHGEEPPDPDAYPNPSAGTPAAQP